MTLRLHTCLDNVTVTHHGTEGMIPIMHKPGMYICHKCGNAVTF